MLIDDKAQISAEMVLLIGAILVIVLVAGSYILEISQSIANETSEVIVNARDSAINKM